MFISVSLIRYTKINTYTCISKSVLERIHLFYYSSLIFEIVHWNKCMTSKLYKTAGLLPNMLNIALQLFMIVFSKTDCMCQLRPRHPLTE